MVYDRRAEEDDVSNGAGSDPGATAVPGQSIVLVDLAPQAGLREVSAAALDSATASIREMAERVSAATKGLAHRPDGVTVEFGLKLDAAGRAMVARVGAEVHLTVTLTWGGTDG
jgi:hypothetical protein